MARKKLKKSRKKSRKKFDCDPHRWRSWTWTHTSWHDGTGYKIHRACLKCSLIDWAHEIPAKSDTLAGREQVENWIGLWSVDEIDKKGGA